MKNSQSLKVLSKKFLITSMCAMTILSIGTIAPATSSGTASPLSVTVSATQNRSSNFSKAYSLTGNNANDVVSVANAQLGKTGAQLGYTENWCADFVTDVARLAGAKAIPYDYSSRGSCIYLYKYMVNNCGATVVTTPQKGDLVFFDWNGGKSINNLHHVAIVKGYSNGAISLIGGNQGNGNISTRKVTNNSYSINNKYVARIVRPKYNKTNTTPSQPTNNSTYFPQYTGNSGSLVDALNAVGANSSYDYRKKIAAANGISNYSGSAAQNTNMLNKLKSGTLKRPTTNSSTPSVSYFPKYTGSSGSLVDGLKAVGANSSYDYRKKIAAANGISNYSGSAAQNTNMLNKLKSGTLKRP